MFIKNQTRGVMLAEKAEMADNIVSRFFGLMGRATLPEGEGLVIAPLFWRAYHVYALPHRCGLCQQRGKGSAY